ncbi:luciferase family protein [Patulibacter minatonensis]|uniref:luciferase domain-containing protein n=1 Tax=Patulibacter minatonensis TaxID=298163 RepID=UPI000688BA23|nr:luciferase family protein [Patulibacter minatonensis]
MSTTETHTTPTAAAGSSPSARIFATATAWPGVTLTGPGERGEMSLMLGRREVGHLHGDRVAHFAFGMELGRRLRDEGHVEPHPVTDKPTLGARRITSDGDVADVVELLGLNYDRIVARYGLPEDAGV